MNALMVRQRMVAVQRQSHGRARNDKAPEAVWTAAWRPHQTEVQFSLHDRSDLIHRRRLLEDHFDAWMQLLKSADEFFDQAIQRHDRHEADGDPADLAA